LKIQTLSIFEFSTPNTTFGENLQFSQTKLGRKIYLPIELIIKGNSGTKCSGLLDSGADLSIGTLSYLTKLFPQYTIDQLMNQLKPTNVKIQSYSSHSLDIAGVLELKIKLHGHSDCLPLNLYVVKDTGKLTPLILSLNDLADFNVQLSFSNTSEGKIPYLSRSGKQTIFSFYGTALEINYGFGYVKNLKTNQSTTVQFELPIYSPNLTGETVLISEDNVPYHTNQLGIQVIASTDDIELKGDLKIVKAKVTNLGEDFTGFITASIEAISDLIIVPAKKESFNQLKNKSLINEVRYYKYSIPNQPIVEINDNIEEINIPNSDLFLIDAYPNDEQDIQHNLDSINNDVASTKISLSEERHNIKPTHNSISIEEEAKFNDKKHTIQLGMVEVGDNMEE
jgi:hypothetical protein